MVDEADRQEILKRLGLARESATRLSRKANDALPAIGIHGVSVTAGIELRPHVSAYRADVESEFPVHDTPTRNDPDHRTIELPQEVNDDVANRFNGLFGRE